HTWRSSRRARSGITGRLTEPEELDRDGGELEVALGVGGGRDHGCQAAFGQLCFKAFADGGILVDVLDLVAGAVLYLFGVAVELQRRVERQVARRRLSNVEVLVEPLVWRSDEAARLPRRDDFVLALFPHHR